MQSWLKDAASQPSNPTQPNRPPSDSRAISASRRNTNPTHRCRRGLIYAKKEAEHIKCGLSSWRLIATCTCGWLTNCCEHTGPQHVTLMNFRAACLRALDLGDLAIHSMSVGHLELSNHSHRRRLGHICSAPSIYGRLKIWPKPKPKD